MSIAARINIVFITAAITLCCLGTACTAQREYNSAVDRLLEVTQARILGQPYLALYSYRRDEAQLKQLLSGLLQTPALTLAAVHDSEGNVLARVQRDSARLIELPPLHVLRAELSADEPGLAAFDRAMQPAGAGFWSSLIGADGPITLSLPVFSPANPAAPGPGVEDFTGPDAEAAASGSMTVIAYVQAGIDRRELLAAAGPAAGGFFVWCMLMIALCVGAILLARRRVTTQLSELARLADQATAGTLVDKMEIDGSQELKHIAPVINRLIGEINSYRQELDADHKLQAIKAEENASQLSAQTDKLKEANQEIREARGQLHKLAYYDSLTALPNRRLFTEQLGLLLQLTQRESKPLALLILNLDNFKRINDSLGHSTGDLLLLQIAKRLSGCLRGSDLLTNQVESGPSIDLSRLGGDEFTIVLNQLEGVDCAGQVAQRLIDVLVEPIVIDGHELVVSPSIGIAIAPRDGATVEELLRAADVAMYHTRATAGQDFMFYNKDMDSNGPDHLKLEAELRKAIERQQLQLHYQPQVNTSDGSIVAAEALLRWQHPDYGQVPPLKFIPIAEEIGMIEQLGDWVLVEACRQMKEFREKNLALPRIAINVSTFQFNSNFVARMQEVLQQADLPPSVFELDMPETTLINDDNDTFKALQNLKQMGVYLSVDNFGTGYAPLNYLGHHQLDEIKIDRSFVRNCDKRQERARLVLGIISMARSLNLRVAAEGIETEGEYQLLTRNGVRMLQGYLFSKPIPANKLEQLLTVKWHFAEQIQQFALNAELTGEAGALS